MPRTSAFEQSQQKAFKQLKAIDNANLINGNTYRSLYSKIFSASKGKRGDKAITEVVNQLTLIPTLSKISNPTISTKETPAVKITKATVTQQLKNIKEGKPIKAQKPREPRKPRSTSRKLYEFVVTVRSTTVIPKYDNWMSRAYFYSVVKTQFPTAMFSDEKISTEDGEGSYKWKSGDVIVYLNFRPPNQVVILTKGPYTMTTTGVTVEVSPEWSILGQPPIAQPPVVNGGRINKEYTKWRKLYGDYSGNGYLGNMPFIFEGFKSSGPLSFPIKRTIKYNKKIPNTVTKNTPVTFREIDDFLYGYIQDIEYHEISEHASFEVFEPIRIQKVNQGLGTQTRPENLLMKNATILKNSWLHYANSISPKAYEQTDNICVYAQLSHFLLNPTSGLPNKFINRKKVSPEAIYNFLQTRIPDLQFTHGVSSKMVGIIGEETNRSVYAYDFNEKCFFRHITTTRNSNYCPILFYRANGHMYLIDSKEATKSVVEKNKADTSVTIKTVPEEPKKNEVVLIYPADHDTVFDGVKLNGRECKSLSQGVYLLNRYSICTDVIKFIKHYKDTPRVKCRDGFIVSLSFKNIEDKIVTIECDANYSKGAISYTQLSNVAVTNEINYVNEGVGSVILKILSKKNNEKREYLNEASKCELIESFENKCSHCQLSCEKFEIDHVVPLSDGGTNDIDNLQPLCVECHKKKTEEERKNGDYMAFKGLEEVSFFNNNVFTNVISTFSFKTWQFVETLRASEPVNPTDFVEKKIDINKCRRNILYFSKFEFPVFSVMDTVMPFNTTDEIEVGSYYIETKNVFPFRGCGWYSHAAIILGLEENLINRTEIKLKLTASKKLPCDHFKKNIDVLLEAFSCEPNLQKLCINAYVGLMGKSSQETSKTEFTLDKFEAANMLCADNAYIINHDLNESQTLYQSKSKQKLVIDSTMYPVYAQILSMEAFELYFIEKLVGEFGGTPLDRNTDAVRYNINASLPEIEIEKYFWDDEMTVKKYKWETPKPLITPIRPSLNRSKDDGLHQKFNLFWDVQFDYDGEAIDKAREIVESKKSTQLNGPAGTGKSYLTNKIIEVLKEQKLNFLAFSPTHKGARIISGETIDSLYHKVRSSSKSINKFKNIDVVLIDEVSMMKEQFYAMFVNIKKSAPQIQFIVTGDFEQLPPVNDSWEGDYKNSAALHELCDGNRLQLTKNRRSEPRLFELCQDVSKINISEFTPKTETYLNIAYTHKTRKDVNKKCLDRFLKEEIDSDEVTLFIPADKKNPKTQDVTLCAGIPVVCHKTPNDKAAKKSGNGFLNSERFIVQLIENDTITLIGNGDREIIITKKDFHRFFYIAFCITVHTSQGETFNVPYTIYDWDFYRFCKKAKYVAMSRATSIENVQIHFDKKMHNESVWREEIENTKFESSKQTQRKIKKVDTPDDMWNKFQTKTKRMNDIASELLNKKL
jgi:5-methylcytosine-specific restriction protein A